MAPNIQLTLRTALIAAFIPAFALCIAAGVTTRHVLPAISLIPMSGSFLSSIIILSVNHWKIDDANHDPESRTFGPVSLSGPRSKASNPLILFLWDTFLAVCIIGLLVGSWLYFDHFSGPKLILATYATVPLLASFFIHLILAVTNLRNVGKALKARWNAPSECPNCHARYHHSSGHVSAIRGPEDYTLARPSEEEQQPFFRDHSFDGDAVIQPDASETGSKAS